VGSNNPAAPVNIAPQPQQNPGQNLTAQRQEQKQDQKQDDKGGQQNQNANNQQDKKDQPKTARQELAERKMEAAKAEAAQKGKNLANEMGKVDSMEQQVAVQNIVVQAMGFTPGFNSYTNSFIPGGVMYKEYSVYDRQQNVDNARLGRGLFGPSDRSHTEMVNSQYK
jgi:hypothetical protein